MFFSTQPTLDYDRKKNYLYVSLAGIHFETPETIDRVFGIIRSYWRAHCKGVKVYAIIDYTDVHIETSVFDYYAESVKSIVDECTITTIRYTNDLLTRATLRRIGVRTHKPSNLYSTREEALEVVEAISKNLLAVDNSA